MYESGELARMLDGFERVQGSGECETCGGARFVPCTKCHGTKRVRGVAGVELASHASVPWQSRVSAHLKCSDCDERGLQRCTACSYADAPAVGTLSNSEA